MIKKILLTLLKVGVSAALLGYLFSQAVQNDHFAALRDDRKNWSLLSAAWLLIFSAVTIAIVRWHFLVRAIDLPITLINSLRLGFLGYLLSFFTLGIAGGDGIRAVFLARECPGRRAEAVATVFLDRVFGLFGLALVAGGAYFMIDWSRLDALHPDKVWIVRGICQAAGVMSAACAAGAGFFLLPGITEHSFWRRLISLPKVGDIVEQLRGAMRMYRRQVGALVLALLMSMTVHVLISMGIFAIATGLPGATPSWESHLAIVPMANLAGAAPVPGGLGAVEFALDKLYLLIGPAAIEEGRGFVVALAYLFIRITIASAGLAFYLTHRREVGQLLEGAEELSVQQG